MYYCYFDVFPLVLDKRLIFPSVFQLSFQNCSGLLVLLWGLKICLVNGNIPSGGH